MASSDDRWIIERSCESKWSRHGALVISYERVETRCRSSGSTWFSATLKLVALLAAMYRHTERRGKTDDRPTSEANVLGLSRVPTIAHCRSRGVRSRSSPFLSTDGGQEKGTKQRKRASSFAFFSVPDGRPFSSRKKLEDHKMVTKCDGYGLS